MPTFARKELRRNLALHYIRDAVVGTTSFSIAINGTVFIMDRAQANTAFSGEQLYERAWLRVASGDYRVASFNVGSGAFVTVQNAPVNSIAAGDDYEVHQKISPTDKDAAIDETIKRVRLRREVGINAVDNQHVYPLDGAASPHYLLDVLDVAYYANPTGSLGRDQRRLTDWRIVTTATGRELRIEPAIAASQQIAIDAILIPSLGASDAATLNIPDDRWILAGAAAQCYHLMIQQAPGQEAQQLAQRRAEWAQEYSRLSSRFQAAIDRPIRLHEVGD